MKTSVSQKPLARFIPAQVADSFINSSQTSQANIRAQLLACLKQAIEDGSDVNDISDEIPFMDLGLDSLALLQFVRMVNQSFQTKLPQTILFDHPTMDSLVSHLTHEVGNKGKLNMLQKSTAVSLKATVRDDSVAITGMSCRFPGGIEGPNMFWDVIQSGCSVVGKVPFNRWDCDAVAASDPTLDEDTHDVWWVCG
jgi:acyl carrier protein